MGPVYVVVISVQLDLPKLDVRLRTGENGHGPIPPCSYLEWVRDIRQSDSWVLGCIVEESSCC
jgi:hypothetical protein